MLVIFGRDVIHGYKTIFSIPLGLAASWNPQIVENVAGIAARKASSDGIRWTFAPMVDVSRDPRLERIAESYWEDPCLTSILGAAIVCVFQENDLSNANSVAACAKHFGGYGAAEAGKDYKYNMDSRYSVAWCLSSSILKLLLTRKWLLLSE